jgi:hypothetical protein
MLMKTTPNSRFQRWTPPAVNYGKMTWLFLLIIIILSSYLALQGLGDSYFWDDEAGTAIFSKNLMRSGKLTAWDGRNLMAYRNGFELDAALINRYFPPMQFLVTAASFRMIGVSTFTARLPFVLIGLASLWFLFLLLWLGSRQNSILSLSGVLLLALSPSFLLFIRQSRYFALVILFPIWIYFFYQRYISTGRWIHLAAFTIGLIALFFSHYLICVAFACALIGIHIVYNLRARPLLPFMLSVGIFAAVVLVYTFCFHIIIPFSAPIGVKNWAVDRLTIFLWNLRDLNGHNFFPWMMIGVLIWLFLDKNFNRGLKRKVSELVLLIIIFIVIISIFSPQSVFPGGDADIRYLVALLPFCCAILGIGIFFLWSRWKSVGVAIALLVIFTNLLSWNPFYRVSIRGDLVSYLKEIHGDYITAYEATVDFIRTNCRQDDVVVVVPLNMSYPLQFYTGDKIIFGGRLFTETRLQADRIRALNPALLIEECDPDWIISFRLRAVTDDVVKYFRSRGIIFDLFRRLDVHYLGESIRPEILLHDFQERTDFPYNEGIFIYKRRYEQNRG